MLSSRTTVLYTYMCTTAYHSFHSLQVGKVALLEVVLLADALGYSVVATALALASLEAAIEFGASAIVPLLYRWAFGTWALSARGLMQFAVGAYTVSAGVACVVYPLLGIVTQGAGVQTEASLLVFALCHAFQYPFLNQLGDQVRFRLGGNGRRGKGRKQLRVK